MSLIPDEVAETTEETTTEEVASTEVQETTEDTGEAKAFMYAEDVTGDGEVPEWFKSSKYKTVSDQAKAYTELESKFGSFTGAPKDGKYEIDGVDFDENPLMGTVAEWGAEKGLSNEGLGELYSKVSELAQKQVDEDRVAAIEALGEKGQERLRNLADWGRNNLDPDAYVQFQGLAQNAGQVEVLEAIIGKTKNSKLVDKTEVETTNTRGNKEEELKAMQFATNEDGKRLMDVDSAYKAKFNRMMKEFYGN